MPNNGRNVIPPDMYRVQRQQTPEIPQSRAERVASSFRNAVREINQIENPVQLARYTMSKVAYFYPPFVVDALPRIFPVVERPVPVRLSRYLHPKGPQPFAQLKIPPDREFRLLEGFEYVKKLIKTSYLGPKTRELIRLQYKSTPNNMYGRLVGHLNYKMRTIGFTCKLNEGVQLLLEESVDESCNGREVAELGPHEQRQVFEKIFSFALLARLLVGPPLSLDDMFNLLVGGVHKAYLHHYLEEFAAEQPYSPWVPDDTDKLAAECLLQDALGLPTHHREMIESPRRLVTPAMAKKLGEKVVECVAADDYKDLIERICTVDPWCDRVKASPFFVERTQQMVVGSQAKLAAFEEERETEGTEAFKMSEQEALDHINALATDLRGGENGVISAITRDFLAKWLRTP